MTILVTIGVRRHIERVNADPVTWGHLITPRCYCNGVAKTTGIIGVDNDRFNEAYDERKFLKTVEYAAQFRDRVRFVAAPDVVGDGAATLKEFESWSLRIRSMGMPAALVLQDGMTIDSTPWADLDAVFVGGTTEWKLGQEAANIVIEAVAREVWVHVGRVNSVRRMNHFRGLQADSMDGTTFGRFELASVPKFERALSKPSQLRMF